MHYKRKAFKKSLATQKPVSAAPGGHSIVRELMKELSIRHITNTTEEVCNMLSKEYKQRKDEGLNPEIVPINNVRLFGRENLLKKFSSYPDKMID